AEAAALFRPAGAHPGDRRGHGQGVELGRPGAAARLVRGPGTAEQDPWAGPRRRTARRPGRRHPGAARPDRPSHRRVHRLKGVGMPEKYGSHEQAALFALMLARTEVGNPDLKKDYGIELRVASRDKLNKDGLIRSWQVKRRYVHQ